MAEVGDLTICALHVLIIAGEKDKARQLLNAIGFQADDVGSNALLDAIWGMGIGKMGTYSRETWFAMNKLLVFLALTDDEQSNTSEDMKTWIATQDLKQINKSWFTQALGPASVLNLGARVYEILGNTAKAKELAEAGVEHQKKKSVASDCHVVLGRIAAKSNDADTALNHFRNAADIANTARCPLLALLAGKECILAGSEADGNGMIDVACETMGKPRGAFQRLL